MTSHDMALRRSGRLMVIRPMPAPTWYNTVVVPDTPASAEAGSVLGSATAATVVPDPCRRPSPAGPGRSGSVAAPWPDLSPPSSRSAWAAPTGCPWRRPKWSRALEALGFDVRTVAGRGPVDRLVPGLAIDATAPPTAG